MRQRAEEIKRAELAKALGRLANLSPQEKNLIESLASGIVSKLLHGTVTTLKAEADSHQGMLLLDAARRFHNLEDIPSPDAPIEAPAETPPRQDAPSPPSLSVTRVSSADGQADESSGEAATN